MSAVGRSPLSPSSPDSIMQAAAELEQNPSMGCLHQLFLVFVYDLHTQDSGLGLFANAQNILINGSTFVSHSQSCINLIHLYLLFSLDQQCPPCQCWQRTDEVPCIPQTKFQSTVYWTERCA